MNFWKKTVYSVLTIAANCLLGLLLIFYDRFLVPPGYRLWPDASPIPSFPIVLLVISAAWVAISPRLRLDPPGLAQRFSKGLLLFTAFSSALTALMGIFLSKERAMTGCIALAQMSGVAVSVLLIMVLFLRQAACDKVIVSHCDCQSARDHFHGPSGADITHGEKLSPGARYC